MVTSAISWAWKCKVGVCFRLLLFDRSRFCFDWVFRGVIGGLGLWGLGNLMVGSKWIFGVVWEFNSIPKPGPWTKMFAKNTPDIKKNNCFV